MARRLRIATWNIEWFASLFDAEDRLILDDGPAARHEVSRARQAEAVAEVIRALDPDALMVIEGPDHGPRADAIRALEGFAAHFSLRQRRALLGFPNGTRQEILLLYDPDIAQARHDPVGAPWTPPRPGRRLRLSHAPAAPRFDGAFPLDLDEDGLTDIHTFSKPPLEAEVTFTGAPGLRLIGVHAKSKAPHGARTAREARRRQIANRRKQLAQCVWIRRRAETHLDQGDLFAVLGDFNDGPGLDRYERLFGRSGVEIAVGDLSSPDRALRTPFLRPAASGAGAFTAVFHDHRRGRRLEALLDFIMLSPALADQSAPRWRIWNPYADAELAASPRLGSALIDASDHFPVAVDLHFC